MAKLLDLPDEVIDMIFDDLFDIHPGPRRVIGASAGALCRRLYHLFFPQYYKMVIVRDFQRLKTFVPRLLRQPPIKHLLKHIHVYLNLPKVGGTLVSSSLKSDPSVLDMDVQEEIQNLLRYATKARSLTVKLVTGLGTRYYMDPQIPWSLDLSCCPDLDYVELRGFELDADNLSNVLSHKKLECLQLEQGEYHISSNDQDPQIMEPRKPPTSQATRLEYRPRWGARPFLFETVFLHLNTLTNFQVTLGREMLVKDTLQVNLVALSKQTALRYLCLESPHLPEDIDYQHNALDLSMFSDLEGLVIDSVLVWPFRDGFGHRNDFYRLLPSQLKHLNIRFPYAIVPTGARAGMEEEIDGIVQVNGSLHPSPEALARYLEQHIPVERYTWIENLLKLSSDQGSAETPYPSLESVFLREHVACSQQPGLCKTRNLSFSHDRIPYPLLHRFESYGIPLYIGTRIYSRDDPPTCV